ncbi:MAG: Sua5/YciO/YrdC/YwlC family protein [Synechococcus sp. TMED20]|jgi:L-threonylcarbamoyladenylate synthase|nr:MAG: Sua5/YciO/YrdC/YwlC family protein [Synechococcus sp. TMED20]
MTPSPPVLDAVSLASLLQNGQAAAIPTDTVVGLAVRPEHSRQIWLLKRRPADKPLILMGGDVDVLLEGVEECCHVDARSLAERFWPGALTLVLPARGPIVDLLNPGGCSLGIRIPACPPTCALLKTVGPLATSSANLSGQPAAGSAKEAALMFPALPQLGPQPWPKPSGLASTVAQWCGSGSWQVLRQGAVMLPERF